MREGGWPSRRAFCLASSAGYLVNDVLDREADRADPVKRLRPVASGELGIGAALVWAALLLAAALASRSPGAAWSCSRSPATSLLTLLYSLCLKSVPVSRRWCWPPASSSVWSPAPLAIPVEISHWLIDLRLPACAPAGVRQARAGGRTSPARARRSYPSAFLTRRGDAARRRDAGRLHALHGGARHRRPSSRLERAAAHGPAGAVRNPPLPASCCTARALRTPPPRCFADRPLLAAVRALDRHSPASSCYASGGLR